MVDDAKAKIAQERAKVVGVGFWAQDGREKGIILRRKPLRKHGLDDVVLRWEEGRVEVRR